MIQRLDLILTVVILAAISMTPASGLSATSPSAAPGESPAPSETPGETQISVALTGTGFTGSRTFIDTTNGGKRTPPGQDTEETALLKFFPGKLVDGKLSVPGTAEQPWAWFVTEQ